MAKIWIIEFAVQAKHKIPRRFPIDMLRYDSCYPDRDRYSVSRIEETIDPYTTAKEFEPKPINLIHLSHGNKNWTPTNARWESFGYKVVNIKPAREGY